MSHNNEIYITKHLLILLYREIKMFTASQICIIDLPGLFSLQKSNAYRGKGVINKFS